MARKIKVKRADIYAARTRVALDKELGRSSEPWVEKLAKTKVTPPRPGQRPEAGPADDLSASTTTRSPASTTTRTRMEVTALDRALSEWARQGQVHVVEGLGLGDRPSSETALAAVGALSMHGRALVVLEWPEVLHWRATHGRPDIHTVAVDRLSLFDVMSHRNIIFSQDAFHAFTSGTAAADVPHTSIETGLFHLEATADSHPMEKATDSDQFPTVLGIYADTNALSYVHQALTSRVTSFLADEGQAQAVAAEPTHPTEAKADFLRAFFDGEETASFLRSQADESQAALEFHFEHADTDEA